jgi:hypothetical protein
VRYSKKRGERLLPTPAHLDSAISAKLTGGQSPTIGRWCAGVAQSLSAILVTGILVRRAGLTRIA